MLLFLVFLYIYIKIIVLVAILITFIINHSFINPMAHTFDTSSSIKMANLFLKISEEILRSRDGTVPPKVSKIIIFVCVLIKCVSIVAQKVYFVVKLSLSQISLMLPKFKHFIFTRIDPHYH